MGSAGAGAAASLDATLASVWLRRSSRACEEGAVQQQNATNLVLSLQMLS